MDQLAKINTRDLYELRVERIKVSDNLDQVTAQVPKMAWQQVNAAYDHYAKALREIDLVIQQANHSTEVEATEHSMKDFIDPYVDETEKKG